ncbi:serine hydrolase domain-containing protein [Nonomuraea diastatica]|uniref:serine hydrolase domain-containing protein n=1 Tax=Nonomuraea diastatica TaxID=1848329 RepID=UPI001C7047B6|nr:serine hydrolase domain-containing protein [Nonomuraea diastatica]
MVMVRSCVDLRMVPGALTWTYGVPYEPGHPDMLSRSGGAGQLVPPTTPGGHMRTGVLLMLVLAMTACSPAAGEPPAAFLARTLPEGPGGTVVTARGGRIVHCQGFGLADRAARTPATCDTVYDVMSITKQLTAAAILKLETMGRLRTSDPISAHLGPVPPGVGGITVHHLLTHTAGLPEALGDDYDVLSREDMLAGALASEPLSAPGERFRYSNLGYSVLAAIIEKVSGLGYERFLAEHLFAPAGMTSTGYVLPRWDRSQVAVEYDAPGRQQGPALRPSVGAGRTVRDRCTVFLLAHVAMTAVTRIGTDMIALTTGPACPVGPAGRAAKPPLQAVTGQESRSAAPCPRLT